MKYTYFMIIFIVLILIIACKPTIKGETNKFNNNQQNIIRLKNTFPGFKTFLEDMARKARVIFDEADTIADEDKKIEKMREANRTIVSDRLYNQLNAYTNLLASINNKKNELASVRDREYQTAIRTVIDNINFQVREAEDYIRFSNPRNYNEAVLEAEKAASVLTQAESILDQTIKAIKEEKSKPTPGTSIDGPWIDEKDDSGGRDTSGSGTKDDGSRGGTNTGEKEDLGGRD